MSRSRQWAMIDASSLRIRLPGVAQHHARLHALDLRGVRHADHAGVRHRRVLAQHRLDLRRVDVEPGGLDHALQAHREIEEPVRVPLAEVARVQPGAAVGVNLERLRGGLRVVQVAQHDGGPGDADLAFLAVGSLVGRAGLHDLREHVGKRDADGALAVLRERHGHDAGHRLGEPVAFQQPHLAAAPRDERLEALLHGARQGVCPAEARLDAGKVGPGERRVPGEGVEERRHAHEHVGALAAQQSRDDLGVELRHEDRLASRHEGRVHAHAQPEAVEDGQHRQDRVALAHARPGGARHAFRDEVAVGEHDALRQPRGAAGEEDRGRVVGSALAWRRFAAGRRLHPRPTGALADPRAAARSSGPWRARSRGASGGRGIRRCGR